MAAQSCFRVLCISALVFGAWANISPGDHKSSVTSNLWAIVRRNHTLTLKGSNATSGDEMLSLRSGFGEAADSADMLHPKVLTRNEFNRNHSTGEYQLNIEFSDGNRRYEQGEWEKSSNGSALFVIRGLFTYHQDGIIHNLLYRMDAENGYMTFEDPLLASTDFGVEDEEDCDPNSRFNSRCIDQKLINILLG